MVVVFEMALLGFLFVCCAMCLCPCACVVCGIPFITYAKVGAYGGGNGGVPIFA